MFAFGFRFLSHRLGTFHWPQSKVLETHHCRLTLAGSPENVNDSFFLEPAKPMSSHITLAGGHTVEEDGSLSSVPLSSLSSARFTLSSSVHASILRSFLSSLFAALQAGASVEAHYAPPSPSAAPCLDLWKQVHSSLILSGFVEVVDVGPAGSPATPTRSLTCRKPAFAGVSLRGGAALRGGPKVGAAAAAETKTLEEGVTLVPGKQQAGAWAAAAAGGSGAALIDENALLAGEDFAEGKASAAGGEGGCATKRKACANCSCGCVL